MATVRATSVILAVTVLAFATAGFAADERETTNIAPNAGLEQAGQEKLSGGWTGKLPKGWGCYDNTPAEAGVSDKIYHSGKCSAYLKITKFKGDNRVNTAITVGKTRGYASPDAIVVKPNTKYYFSFYIKGTGFTRKINVVPWGFKTDGTGRDRGFPSVKVVPTEKWTHHVGSFTTKAETGRVVLMFHVFAARDRDAKMGAVFFVDDVYLGTSEAAAKTEVPAAGTDAAVPVLKQTPKPAEKPAEEIKIPPGTPVGYKPVKPGTVRIWDTNKRYTLKRPAGRVWKDKPKWSPVPYGKTDYKQRGDLILENEYFFLFCFTNKGDSVSLIAKLAGTNGIVDNEIYKVHQDERGRRDFGHGTLTDPKILKYTEKEIVIEHAGKARRSDEPVTTTYRIQGGKCWLEVKPVHYVNQQGLHGKNRICAFLNSKSDEYILDGKRATWPGSSNNRPAKPDTIGIINFHRGRRPHGLMWFMTAPPGFEKSKLTYLGHHSDRYWEDEFPPNDRPSCGAQYAHLKDKVIIAVLNRKGHWEREDVLKPIAAGGTYTTKFKAPFPGKWRLIGFVVEDMNYKPRPRVTSSKIPDSFKTPINGKYHYNTVEIKKAGETFAFKSPVAGVIDYLLIYLQDRTKNTPKDVFTPMGVYRQAILGETAEKSKSGTAPEVLEKIKIKMRRIR